MMNIKVWQLLFEIVKINQSPLPEEEKTKLKDIVVERMKEVSND